MLRITRTALSPSETAVKAEGQIIAEWVGLLETECRELLAANHRVVLDLGGVSNLDGRAVLVLRELSAANLELSNCSPLIEELLAEGAL